VLDDGIRKLATGKNFGTICVHLEDGTILSHVMWVDADDEHILINTEIHRTKYLAMQRDPRVTVTVWDTKNAYAYGEVRGKVVGEVRGTEAREHIDALSQRYTGQKYGTRIQSERVIVKIAPDRQRPVGLG